MQADYPEKYPAVAWDPVHVKYPVKKFPETEIASEAIARRWTSQPEVLMCEKPPIEEIKEYFRDYNVTKELTKSQNAHDFRYKPPESKRFYKHNSCAENIYIYPPDKRPKIEPSWHTDLESLDTTHEGYGKYLDPYLTTSRLHHRPFTAEQLARPSVTKDIITYYTLANIPWTRTPGPKEDDRWLPLSRPKVVNDREKFKEDFREIRTHNKSFWVPGTFRTESRDNYRPQSVQGYSFVDHLEEDVRNHYYRLSTGLPTNSKEERTAVNNIYSTETSHIGSGTQICTRINQHAAKNKRLDKRKTSSKIVAV